MKPQSAPVPSPVQAKSTAENVRDTLDSIVLAFILAFVFRAFIVEAFVIPTGSMAVTLYGNHLTQTCSVCGYEYARGVEQYEEMRAGDPRYSQNMNFKPECPNCGAEVDELRSQQIASPDSGDRILVHKWPFDIGGETLGPHRWEVTVFKDPTDGTTNFIKRLVGLPGEVLEIIDGDIYTASLEPTKDEPGLNKVAPHLVAEMDQLRRDVYNRGRELTSADEGSRLFQEFRPRYTAINKELVKYLRIHRKVLELPRAQESLWFNVYDHDYLPNYASLSGSDAGAQGQKLVGWYAEDAPAIAAWGTGPSGLVAERELRFKSTSPETLFLHFAGREIVDYSAYNHPERNRANQCTVGDVRLRFTWFPEGGDGALVLRTNRDQATFTAELRADGSATLIHQQPELTGGQQEIGRVDHAFDPNSVVEVEFMVVDYLVRLVVNGQPVIQSNDQQYKPDPARILARRRGENDYDSKPTEVRIGARGLACRLRHLVLERDEYYRDVQQGEPERPNPEQKRDFPKVINPYHNWPGWGTAGLPILLRDKREVNGETRLGEYLMLGDNSAASKDSRMWWDIGPHLVARGEDYQVGTVPGDQLIGEAFFVYWPAGFRLSLLRSTPFGRVGLIPNFGRMRWIR